MDLAKLIDGKKFMWDGNTYESEKAAEETKAQYETDGFETEVFCEDGKYYVFNRRGVTEIIVEGQPPI